MAEMIFVFSMVVGIGMCVYVAFRAKKIRFSLQTIFVTVTGSCLVFAMTAAFGLETLFYAAAMLLGFFLPLLNLAIIGMVIVTIVNTRGERQAVQIGRLIPLVVLAVFDIARVLAFGFSSPLVGVGVFAYVTVFGVFYVTAWASGFASLRAYFAVVAEQEASRSAEPQGHLDDGEEWSQSASHVSPDPQVT